MANHQQKGAEAQARIYPGLRGGKNTGKDVRPEANLTRITNWRKWKVSSEGRRQRCFPERQKPTRVALLCNRLYTFVFS